MRFRYELLMMEPREPDAAGAGAFDASAFLAGTFLAAGFFAGAFDFGFFVATSGLSGVGGIGGLGPPWRLVSEMSMEIDMDRAHVDFIYRPTA